MWRVHGPAGGLSRLCLLEPGGRDGLRFCRVPAGRHWQVARPREGSQEISLNAWRNDTDASLTGIGLNTFRHWRRNGFAGRGTRGYALKPGRDIERGLQHFAALWHYPHVVDQWKQEHIGQREVRAGQMRPLTKFKVQN